MGPLLARLRGLTGNRWAVAGLLGAAGLGAFALTRGGGKAGGGVDSGQAADSAGEQQTPYVQPSTYPNTYATDLASALGDLDSRYAESLADFTGQLGTTSDAIAALKTQQQTSMTEVNKQLAALAAKKATVAAGKPKATSSVSRKPNKPSKPKPKASAPKASAWKVITIRRGDTLGAIAKRYDTTVGKLAAANKISNPNRIIAGHKLRVPG